MDDIIPTVSLEVLKDNQTSVRCRALLDTGSTKNFIIEHLASLLQLSKRPCHTPIHTLNESYTISNHKVTATVRSRLNAYKKTLEFLVVPSITSLIPDTQVERKSLKIPPNIELADPEFHKPAAIQLLLGAGVSLNALCVGQIKLSATNEPDMILQKSQFGWIIGGSTPAYPKASRGTRCLFAGKQEDMSRFWEIEDLDTAPHLSAEEKSCETHFLQTISRDEDGRFVAALPFNDKHHKLGESYLMASKRLASLERRFNRDSHLKTQYHKAIQEYIDLGYVSKVQTRTPDEYFIPHQAVFKQSSQTTKIRVVFDASAASSSGISLNDALMAGPTIQDNIFSLLLRFRMHRYVLTGDIEKMYLPIKIREQDQPRLRFLWKGEDDTPDLYQFNRLIFGLKPASYIATRCLHRLAEEEERDFPLSSQILKRDLYVDDLLTGANTVSEVIQLQKDLTALLQRGGFNLRQCASNATEVLHAIPDRCVNLQLQNTDDATLKTLGVHWASTDDQIVYTVTPVSTTRVTKRSVFSEVAKIYDPLGLLNPVIVTAKLLIQELWKLKINWDESLPATMHTKWDNFMSGLSAINEMAFCRRVLQDDSLEYELHGFCDASERAYGACLYVRTTDREGNSHVNLLCAKSRVAPITNVQTIPRLELCAALLLANLYANVRNAVTTPPYRATFWTDSMIALHWTNASPHELKSFVANRVSNIQSLTDSADWRHVRTHDNPADLLSRGVTPSELKKRTIWEKGPNWLAGGESLWPPRPSTVCEDIPERRSTTCLTVGTIDTSLLLRYSSYTRLTRIVALCRRFLPTSRKRGLLAPEELQIASDKILALVQRSEFHTELHQLKKGKEIPAKSRLLPLNPFLGGDGLIRVGGKLQLSDLPFTKKHQIVLPKAHHVTRLIIEREHLNTLHGGVQTTLSAVRQLYWPLDGKNQVRKVIRNCTRCTRLNPPSVNYVMGSVSKVRSLAGRPFVHAGVDYCGPFYIKEKRYRNRVKIKTYVAVFVCLATKAIHLEVVSDLTTDGFIAALKRFISRRGKVASLSSDNGTNFVGADNELKEIHNLLISPKHNERVDDYLAPKGIVWKFIPPQSPHFGGLWEAAVKSFKHHLRRVVGNELFTFEEFNTLVIEIEAVLNSRPLTCLSSDPHDLSPLTPAHFLIGDSLSGLPEHDLSGVAINRLTRWQHIQKVKRDFWVRWHKEYIHELNIRRKWVKGEHPLRQGSIVLVRDDNAPPMHWRMARIIETYPGPDGVVRTARIKTAAGELMRSVKKLAPLLAGEENSEQRID